MMMQLFLMPLLLQGHTSIDSVPGVPFVEDSDSENFEGAVTAIFLLERLC